MINDFKKLIGDNFGQESEISLNIERPHSPSFCVWLWSKNQENHFISTAWLAVMGGEVVGYEQEGKIQDDFDVSVTRFLFDETTKKRLRLNTGESIIEFIFKKAANGRGYWHYVGWCQDVYGEWEDLEYE